MFSHPCKEESLGLGERWRSAWAAIRGASLAQAGGPGLREIAEAAAARGSALAGRAWRAALAIGLLSIVGYAARGDAGAFLRIASLGLLVGGAGLGTGVL